MHFSSVYSSVVFFPFSCSGNRNAFDFKFDGYFMCTPVSQRAVVSAIFFWNNRTRCIISLVVFVLLSCWIVIRILVAHLSGARTVLTCIDRVAGFGLYGNQWKSHKK